jgi:hypothetical protein
MPRTSLAAGPDRPCQRQFARFAAPCPARIRIGARQYFGYLDNISRGGAKLTTVTAIRGAGPVLLQLPDLMPLTCKLRWTGEYDAGVSFETPLSLSQLRRWARNRLSFDAIDAD